MAALAVLLGLVLLVILIVLAQSIRVVREYERVVVFRLGKVVGARGPGLVIVLPVIERMLTVNMQVVTFDVTPQDIITKDNVTVRVGAVVVIRDYAFATQRIAQTTLRATLGQHELDDLLANRTQINTQLQVQIDE